MFIGLDARALLLAAAATLDLLAVARASARCRLWSTVWTGGGPNCGSRKSRNGDHHLAAAADAAFNNRRHVECSLSRSCRPARPNDWRPSNSRSSV